MGVWSQEMQWYQRVSSNFRGVISSNSGWIDAFLLFILIKKEGKKNNQQCLDHSQNPDLYGAGLPTHDKEKPSASWGIRKVSRRQSTEQNTDSRMYRELKWEKEIGKHDAQEDKQKRKHRGKPEGRGKR